MVFSSTLEVTRRERCRVISNFVHKICGCGLWNSENIIDLRQLNKREQIGDQKVLLGLSGGVDSVVAAFLQSDWRPVDLCICR